MNVERGSIVYTVKYSSLSAHIRTDAFAQTDHILKFDTPAQYLEESLPLGNEKQKLMEIEVSALIGKTLK